MLDCKIAKDFLRRTRRVSIEEQSVQKYSSTAYASSNAVIRKKDKQKTVGDTISELKKRENQKFTKSN